MEKDVVLYVDGIYGSGGIVNVRAATVDEDFNETEVYRKRWAAVEHIWDPMWDALWSVGEQVGGADPMHRDTARDTGCAVVKVVWNSNVLSDEDLDELEQDYYEFMED